MNTLYIGHGYQALTLSTAWLVDALRKHSRSLEVIADHGPMGGPSVSPEDVLSRDFDKIVVFQMLPIARALAKKIPERVVFVPMYDDSHTLPDTIWAELSDIRIINFSKVLHERLCTLGLRSRHFQFFPNPADHSVVSDFSNFRGFFWLRRRDLGWPIIRQLAQETHWSKFSLRNAPDPISVKPRPPLRRIIRQFKEFCGLRPPSSSVIPELPDSSDAARFNLTILHGFYEKSEFNRIVSEANIFFAPRRYEGIGMAYLEAMARGQCVVAPDRPTHSEYLVNGVSGILYDPDSPVPLNLTAAAAMGAAARERIERGFPQWQADLKEKVPEFIFE